MKKSQQNKISWKEYYNIFVGWTSEQKFSIHNHVLMFKHIHTKKKRWLYFLHQLVSEKKYNYVCEPWQLDFRLGFYVYT